MLIPTKHERLSLSLIVLGGDVLTYLKKHEELPLDDIFQHLKTKKNISLDRFNDTILFLWLSDLVSLDTNILSIRNATAATLH
jgi:hypothetical protein